MARRLDAGLGRELFVVDAKGPESDRNNIPGLERGHGPFGIATAGELFALEADPGVDSVAQVLGPGPGLSARVRDGHVGRGCAEARKQSGCGEERAVEQGGSLHGLVEKGKEWEIRERGGVEAERMWEGVAAFRTVEVWKCDCGVSWSRDVEWRGGDEERLKKQK